MVVHEDGKPPDVIFPDGRVGALRVTSFGPDGTTVGVDEGIAVFRRLPGGTLVHVVSGLPLDEAATVLTGNSQSWNWELVELPTLTFWI